MKAYPLLALLAVFFACVFTSVADPDLVLHYDFNTNAAGTAYDQSTSGNDGTIVGATWTSNGFDGGALDFDGTNDYIALTNALGNATTFTIAAWVYPRDVAKDYQYIYNECPDPSFTDLRHQYSIHTADGIVVYDGGYPPSGGMVSAGDALVQNAWNFVVVTRSGGTVTHYINGSPSGSGTTTSFSGSGSGSLANIGARIYNSTYDQFYDGLIDDIKIYDSVLTPEQISEEYRNKTRLVLHYTFDNDDGTNVWDASGNGYHGYTVGPVNYYDGVSGAAPRFTSHSTYIVSPSTNLNMNGWTQVTVSAWIKLVVDGSRNRFLDRGGVTTSDDGGMSCNYGGALFGNTTRNYRGNFAIYRDGQPSVTADPPELYYGTTPVVGEWIHFVGTYDGVNSRCYLNGELRAVSTNTLPGGPIHDPANTKMVIGNNANTPAINWTDYFFNGLVDELKIYRAVLTPVEVHNLYLEKAVSSLSEGLLAYYPFNGNANDESGNGHHGTLDGPVPAADKSATPESAYLFDGVNDRIDISSVPISQAVSVSAWIKTSDSNTISGTVVGFDGSYILWTIADGTFQGKCKAGSTTTGPWPDGPRSTVSVDDSQWHHLAWTRGVGGAQVLYLDGLEIESGSYSSESIPVATFGRFIGTYRMWDGAWRSPFNGMIDEVRIYDRVITPSEVAQLAGIQSVASLSVYGTPGEYGESQPYDYGLSALPDGATITNTVVSPVLPGSGVRYLCAGWTGTGDVPASGAGTSVVFVATQSSSLTWLWDTEYWLDTAAGTNGSVDVGGAWHNNGAQVVVTATPANGYRFLMWSGDVPSGDSMENPLTLTMDQARSVTAVFQEETSGINYGCVLYYSCSVSNNSSVIDDSANGNNGTVSGPTWTPNGAPGGAYEFDGANDIVYCNSAVHDPAQGTTYSAWFRADNIDDGIILLTRNSNYNRFGISVRGGAAIAQYYDGDNDARAGGIIDSNNWYHFVGTFDGSIVRAYLNGHEVSAVVTNGGISGALDRTVLGQRTDASNISVFDGAIDETRIYNRVLSRNEILQLYNARAASSLELHYTFDADSATTVLDRSGHRRDGTVYGGAAWTATGIDGGAMTFDGVNGRIETPYDAALFPSGEFTVCAWVKRSVDDVMHTFIAATYDNPPDEFTYELRTDTDNKLGLQSYDAGRVFLADSQEDVTAGSWHFVCGTFDRNLASNNAKVYMDGVLVGADTYSNPLGGYNGPLNVGCYQNRAGGAQYRYLMNGLIDDVRVYSSSLQADEVRGLYAAGPGNNILLNTCATPELRGTPTPYGYGSMLLDPGTTVSNSVVSPIVDGTTREVCAGWTGTGSIPASGSGNSVAATILNNSTITWHWETQYYLDTGAGANGEVDLADDWHVAGSNVTITATATSGYHLVSWQGDIPGGSETNNPLTLTMDQARVAVAVFAPDAATGKVDLVTGGFPAEHGTPTPCGYGTNTLAMGSSVAAGVNAVVAGGGVGTQYVCVGWTGNGSVPATGTSNSVDLVVTNNSTLTWQWETQYYLDTGVSGDGTVDVADGWHTGLVVITPTPLTNYYFSNWIGDVPGGSETNNPLTLTMDRARSVTAVFLPYTATIAGQVYYTGTAEGTIYVEAFNDADYANRVAWTSIPEPGNYMLTGVPVADDYWIRAWRDDNTSGRLDTQEPAGGYHDNPIEQLSENLAGVNITLLRVSQPQGVAAYGGVGCITVEWDANPEPGIAGYNIYRFDYDWGVFERLNTAPIIELKFVDRAVRSGETYFYYVSAVIQSEFLSDYMEGPASMIVGAVVDTIGLWMPDFNGGTGDTVRLSINVSSAEGILGNDMFISVSYNTNMLTPISQVDTNRESVETTVLTEFLTVSNNADTATGVIEIATSNPGGTHATLRILGCGYAGGVNKPIPMTTQYSVNGGAQWFDINAGNDVNKGRSWDVDLPVSIPDATNCLLRVKEWGDGRTRQSNDASDFVKVLRNGDVVTNLPGVYGQEDLAYYLREYIDANLVVNIGTNDAIYLFEMSTQTHGPAADYQDLVAIVEFNEGAALIGEGRLFDVIFRVAPDAAPGAKQTNAFVSAIIKDQAGNVIPADISDTAVFTVQNEYKLGDVNGDGLVTCADTALVLDLALGTQQPTAQQLAAGDIDGNGRLTKRDATLIMRLVGGMAINPGGQIIVDSGTPNTNGYQVTIGDYELGLNEIALVPVEINDATGVAAIDMRVNFDDETLSLQYVSNSALTASFTLDYQIGDGYVDIIMADSNAISSGSGTLCYLAFYVQPSANVGQALGLSISRCQLSDEYGRDLHQESSVGSEGGSATLILSDLTDSDGDGLTDYAEQMSDSLSGYSPWHAVNNPFGTDTDPFNADTDGDGMLDGDEIKARCNALDGSDLLNVLSFAKRTVPVTGFELEWPTKTGVTYRVDFSADLLAGWTNLSTNIPGTGSTRSFVDTNPVTGPRFYIIKGWKD